MADHWYWCVTCLTPGCGEIQALKYIGPASFYQDGLGTIPVSFPVPFRTRCGTCQAIHSYELRPHLRPLKLPIDPPTDFRDKF